MIYFIFYFDTECGLTYPTFENKLIGGINGLPNSWPSIVVIKVKTSILGVEFFCQGNLIDRQTILTSAFCLCDTDGITPLPLANYTVFVNYENNPDTAGNYQFITEQGGLSISKIILHEKYDTTSNDIALLTLSKKVVLNRNVQIACLPQRSDLYPSVNTTVYLAGWVSSPERYVFEETKYYSKNDSSLPFIIDYNSDYLSTVKLQTGQLSVLPDYFCYNKSIIGFDNYTLNSSMIFCAGYFHILFN